jgi:protein-disulfide isomerase
MKAPTSQGMGPDLAEPINESDHVQGAASAPVTLVEYGDFECPLCGQAFPAVKLIQQRFGSQLRFAYRHFPLNVHPNAQRAAEAAEAAGAQGMFWEMHERLFRHQLHLKPSDLERYAAELGLDLRRFEVDLNSGVYGPRVQADIASGVRSRVKGTPGFFVNGKVTDTSFGLQHLMQAIERVAGA